MTTPGKSSLRALRTDGGRRFYNLEHDDGVTLANDSNQSWSLKRSYLEVISGLRAVLGRERIMLMNSLGYSSAKALMFERATLIKMHCCEPSMNCR